MGGRHQREVRQRVKYATTISTSTDDAAAPPSGVIRSRRGEGNSALATEAKSRRTGMERIRIV
jgi:hypothetical protein